MNIIRVSPMHTAAVENDFRKPFERYSRNTFYYVIAQTLGGAILSFALRPKSEG
jgi:hypothetical protein